MSTTRRRTWLIMLVVSVGGLAALPAGAGATGTPSLQFVVQPDPTVVNQAITGSAFNPSGPPLQVDILTDSGKLATGSSAPVTISLAANPGGATLSGTTTVDAVNGVATFSNLSLDVADPGYQLLASSPGATPATSQPFQEVDAGINCPGTGTCTTSASTPTSTFTMSVPAGTPTRLTISFNIGTPLVCQGYSAQDPSWYSFASSSSATGKTITYRVRPNSSAPGALASTQFCLGAPYEFESRTGAPAPAGTLPDGSAGFIGLVLDCHAGTRWPCIAKRASEKDPSSPTGFDVVLTVSFPAGLAGDPWGKA